MSEWFEASAPARVDLAGGTLDLWPLHVLHPGSVTVNLAIDLRARCRVRARRGGVSRHGSRARLRAHRSKSRRQLLADPRGALAGAVLEALEIREPREIELSSDVPFGSGLGGSSALTVAMAAALAASVDLRFEGAGRVEFVRDVETRVLGKPAGIQDYYPPLAGGLHTLRFQPGRVERRAAGRRRGGVAAAPDALRHRGGAFLGDEQLGDLPRPPGGRPSRRRAPRRGPGRRARNGRGGAGGRLPGDGGGAPARVGGPPAARAGRLLSGDRGGDRIGDGGGRLGRQGLRRRRRRVRRDPRPGRENAGGAGGAGPAVDRSVAPGGRGEPGLRVSRAA